MAAQHHGGDLGLAAGDIVGGKPSTGDRQCGRLAGLPRRPLLQPAPNMALEQGFEQWCDVADALGVGRRVMLGFRPPPEGEVNDPLAIDRKQQPDLVDHLHLAIIGLVEIAFVKTVGRDLVEQEGPTAMLFEAQPVEGIEHIGALAIKHLEIVRLLRRPLVQDERRLFDGEDERHAIVDRHRGIDEIPERGEEILRLDGIDQPRQQHRLGKAGGAGGWLRRLRLTGGIVGPGVRDGATASCHAGFPPVSAFIPGSVSGATQAPNCRWSKAGSACPAH